LTSLTVTLNSANQIFGLAEFNVTVSDVNLT